MTQQQRLFEFSKQIFQELLAGTKEYIAEYQQSKQKINISSITLPNIDSIIEEVRQGLESDNEQLNQKYTIIANQIVKYQSQISAITEKLYSQYTDMTQIQSAIISIIESYCKAAESCLTYPKIGNIRKACVMSSLKIYLDNSLIKSQMNVFNENLISEIINLQCQQFEHSVKQTVKGVLRLNGCFVSCRQQQKKEDNKKEDDKKEDNKKEDNKKEDNKKEDDKKE